MATIANGEVDRDKKIIIVGAGVFGLTSALHLARCGYNDIHMCDYQMYHENSYACSAGCDAASCDENKILRASYGDAKLYQDLAFKAMPEWQKWNEMLASTPKADLPPSLTPDEKLWNNCGFLRLSKDGLEDVEEKTQRNFPKSIQATQYRVSDARRRQDAAADGIPESKIDPFDRLQRGLPTDGVLDTTSGFVLASRACAFALHLCHQLGVHTYFGPDYGMKTLVRKGNRVTGLITNDGNEHFGDVVIVACGGWTPSLVHETEQLIETTGGSVLSIRLPQDRKDLWEKYSPEKFPVWSWNMNSYERNKNDIGGLYGMPRTPEGVLKVAFRGAKWTNYDRKSNTSGKLVSYPKTDVEEIPQQAMSAIRTFCEENLPDLLELELERGRLCWYSDSVDNSFLIDYVPGVENLIVANGGSGHGFKFLPVLGEHVVDVLERKTTPYTQLFKWREVPNGKRNGLEEGPEGWRTLDKQQWAGREQWRRGVFA
jgi:sarcosine oxidase / L-pipecolate oxidase